MDTELKLDLETAKNITDRSLIYDFTRYQAEPTIDSDAVITEITIKHQNNLEEEIKPKSTRVQQLHKELANIQKNIDDTKRQITENQTRQEQLIQQINQRFTAFSNLFPDTMHVYIATEFHNLDNLLRRARNRLGFFEKFSFNKRAAQITKLYTEIRQLMDLAKVDTPTPPTPDLASHNKELRNLTNTQKTKQDELNKLKQDIESAYTKHAKNLHSEVGAWLSWLDTYNTSRPEMRKRIPPMMNMQGLIEPVSFFQTITGLTQSQLTKLLEHVGLSVGYAQSQYIIRPTQTLSGNKCLELITPFYTPQHAQQNIRTLMGYLAEHGARFPGVIKPATYTQINPQTHQSKEISRDELSYLIKQKLNDTNVITRATFRERYSNDTSPQYLFRGQTFITSDPSSSYATPTWRPGRTGLPYATTDANYATTYASAPENNRFVAGKTMNTEYLLSVNNYIVGFVTVFQNSKRNIITSDLALETIEDKRALKRKIEENHRAPFHETAVSPHNNPIVARYMVVGDKMVLIDDQDPTWCQIMDAMAPDLARTHIYGLPATAKDFYTEGWQFIDRLNALEQDKKQNGHVTTYDISPEILAKMGYRTPRQQFSHATNTMHNHMPPVLIADNTKE